jgi:hypothetical protein
VAIDLRKSKRLLVYMAIVCNEPKSMERVKAIALASGLADVAAAWCGIQGAQWQREGSIESE